MLKEDIAYNTKKIEYYNTQPPSKKYDDYIAFTEGDISFANQKCHKIERDMKSIAECPTPITTTDRSVKKYRADFPNFLTDFIPEGIDPISMNEIRTHIPLAVQPTIIRSSRLAKSL